MEFSTRQIFNDSHPEVLENIKFDCNVKLTYRQDPSNLHWITENNKCFLLTLYNIFMPAETIVLMSKVAK